MEGARNGNLTDLFSENNIPLVVTRGCREYGFFDGNHCFMLVLSLFMTNN